MLPGSAALNLERGFWRSRTRVTNTGTDLSGRRMCGLCEVLYLSGYRLRCGIDCRKKATDGRTKIQEPRAMRPSPAMADRKFRQTELPSAVGIRRPRWSDRPGL